MSVLTDNIKRLVDAIAKEIATRCDNDPKVEECARSVLLDWFGGRFIPSNVSPNRDIPPASEK